MFGLDQIKKIAMLFGKVALEAVDNIRLAGMHPTEAWKSAAQKMFSPNCSGITKACPKNAFLGLCQEGLVKGVDGGSYTRSDLNKAYAVKGVEVLKEMDRHFKPKELWIAVLERLGSDVTKKHNSQMDVVLALWEKALIV